MGLNALIFMGRADVVCRLSVWSDFGGSGKKFHHGQVKKCRDFMWNSEKKNTKTNKVKFSLQSETLPVGTCANCFSCVGLFVTLWTVALQAPLSMGILQARILQWVVISSSRGSAQRKDGTWVSYVSCMGRRALYH